MANGFNCPVIIFVQSSRDIAFAVQLVHTHNEFPIQIYVIDHEVNYRVLTRILKGKSVVIRFIRNFSLKNPLLVFLDAIRLRFLYLGHFAKLKKSLVYYFTNYFDYKTNFFINKLSHNNRLYMMDHYNVVRVPNSNLSMSDKLRAALIFFVSGQKCYFSGENRVPTFTLDHKNLTVLKDVELDLESLAPFKKTIDVESPSILFFDMPDSKKTFSDYEKVVGCVIRLFVDNGYNVVVKPHPRSVESASFSEIDGVSIFNDEIPSEFIDFSQFSFVVSAVSAAITEGCVPAISVLELLSFNVAKQKREYREYLNALNDSVVFPDSYHSIEQIISRK